MKFDVELMVKDRKLNIDYLETILSKFIPEEKGSYVFVFYLKDWKIIITVRSALTGFKIGWTEKDIVRKFRVEITLWDYLDTIYDCVTQTSEGDLKRVEGICIKSDTIQKHQIIYENLTGF